MALNEPVSPSCLSDHLTFSKDFKVEHDALSFLNGNNSEDKLEKTHPLFAENMAGRGAAESL